MSPNSRSRRIDPAGAEPSGAVFVANRGGGGRRNNTNNNTTTTTMTSRQMYHQQQTGATPYSGIIQHYITQDRWLRERQDQHHHRFRHHHRNDDPVFGTVDADHVLRLQQQQLRQQHPQLYNHQDDCETTAEENGQSINIHNIINSHAQQQQGKPQTDEESSKLPQVTKGPIQKLFRLLLVLISAISSKIIYKSQIRPRLQSYKEGNNKDPNNVILRPDFVYEHPYVTSSYYTATRNRQVLDKMGELQVDPKRDRPPDRERGIVSRLAILRPFCEFDADALPTTFACWNSLVPCRAAEMDLGDDDDDEGGIDEWVLFDMSVNGTGRKLRKGEEDEWECEADYTKDDDGGWFRGIANAANALFKRCRRRPKTKTYFDDVPADGLRTTSADLFLFYSQTFSENKVAMKAVDEILAEFFSPGGWSRCFDNIYAVEANIPKELDLYIPAAQEELYNWVNGPNRQYEAGFRIIQSGEWGDYDGFYLMEGDSVPVKNYWLDVILGEINAYRPFAVLGA